MNGGRRTFALGTSLLVALVAGGVASCAAERPRSSGARAPGPSPAVPRPGVTPLPSVPPPEVLPPTSPAAPSTRPTADDLDWDSAVGWEPRHHFPRGQSSFQRPEGSTIVLEYALPTGLFAGIAARSAGLPLRDKPLIVRAPAELCHPDLRAAVARLAPDRLLLRIDGNLAEAERDCLAGLPVRDLFVSTCHHDGALSNMERCTDGDAQLAMLASSSELTAKVRGLAIGFGEERSWSLLTRFPRLATLTIRGSALARIDVRAAFGLCDLSELRYVDALVADHPGDDLDVLPPACVMRWTTFRSWTISAPDLYRGLRVPPPPAPVPCRLRRVLAWRMDPDHRARLAVACPDLVELGVVATQERCERTSPAEPLACGPP